METLGRFQILGEIGKGGCGVVYRALDPRIGRQVAIKTIDPKVDPAMAETLRERFRREARAAGTLSHPHIVTIHEFDDTGEITFLVMELVDGRTLAERMASGETLSLQVILSLLKSAAEALDFAHSQGIVHRDVKPANFLITSSGSLKVADFGIAKLANSDRSLTSTGVVIGTAQYMSPEQIGAKPVTGRTDQFSLAIIAYELLTGQKPFQGDSWGSVLHQIMAVDPPPVKQYRANLGDRVTEVLRRALSKDPAVRYPTCNQFIDDLTEAVIGTTIERTLLMPVAETPKSTLPVPGGEDENTVLLSPQIAAHTHPSRPVRSQTGQVLPEPSQTELPPTAEQRKRSPLLPIGIGAGAAAAVIGGWMLLHHQTTSSPIGPTQLASPPQETAQSSQPALPAPQSTAPAAAPVPVKAQPSSSPVSTSSSPSSSPASSKTRTAVESKQAPAVGGSSAAPQTLPPPNTPAPVTIAASQPAQATPPPRVEPPPVAQSPPKSAATDAPAPSQPARPTEADVWNRLRNSTDIATLEQFRMTYPNGAFFAEAGRRIEQLDWERAARAGDAKSYRDYLAKYPAGAFADRANAELAKLDRAQAARQITEALNRYQQAFEGKDLEGLKTVWPALSRSELNSIQSFFRIARSIKLEFRLLSEPEITPQGATLRCRRILSASDDRGAMPPQDQTVRINFRKSGSTVTIESIEIQR